MLQIQLQLENKTINLDPLDNVTVPSCLDLNDTLQHQESQINVSIEYDSSIHKILVENNSIPVSIIEDGKRIFTGIIDSGLSWTDNGTPEPLNNISLVIFDNTYKLQNTAETPIAYINSSLTEIITKICKLCDLTYKDEGLLDAIQIPVFILNRDQEFYQAVNDLLFEYGFAFGFTGTGELTIINLKQTYDEKIIENLFTGVKFSRTKRKYTGIELNYGKITKKDNEQVYFEGGDLGEDNKIVPIIITPGTYYPFESDPRIESTEGQVYQEFSSGYAETQTLYNGEKRYTRSKDTQLLYTENHKLVKDYSDNLTVDRTEFEYTQASVRFVNNSTKDAELKQLAIKATAYYRSPVQLIRGDGKKFKYDSKYIYDKGSANALAALMQHYFLGGNFKITFKTTQKLIPGQKTKINTGLSGIKADVIILSATKDIYSEIYDITALTEQNITLDEKKWQIQKSMTASQVLDRTEIDNITIQTITTEYYLSDSRTELTGGKWEKTPPTATADKYIWTKTIYTYTNGRTEETNPVSISGEPGPQGAQGPKGDKGDSGIGIKSVTEYYLASASNSGITTSTSGWTTSIQTITTEKKYLWNYEKITYSDSSTSSTTPVIIGAYGNTGATGATGATGLGIKSITEHYLASASNSGITASTSGWTTTIQTVTNEKKYLWNYETITYTNNSTSNSSPVIIGVYGDKGDKGATGPQGPQGAQGPKGDNYWQKSEWIDLSGSTYDVETWYPVVGGYISNNGVQEIKVSVQLNSGTKPSWSTHSKGFSVDFHVQDQACGWGTTSAICLKYIDTFNWTKATNKTQNLSPVSYTQMVNSSLPVLYLRGGGRYLVSTTYSCDWSIKTSTFTVASQSVSPSVSARPTPRGTYIQGAKGDKGATGAQGPKGEDSLGFAVKLNVSDLSTTATGTIFVSGYENSVQANVNGYVRYLGNKISVTKTALKPNNQFIGWIAIPVTGGTPVLAYRTVAGQWKSISNGTSTDITGSNYVAIAEARFESALKATASSVIEPIRLDVLGGNIRSIYWGKSSTNPAFSAVLAIGHFYLNTSNGNIYSYNGITWELNNATDLEMQCMTDLLEIAQSSSSIGTPTFINKLVAYTAFINKLLSKEVTIDASTFGFIKSSDFKAEADEWVKIATLPTAGFGIYASESGSSVGAVFVNSRFNSAFQGYIRQLYTQYFSCDEDITTKNIKVSGNIELANTKDAQTTLGLPSGYISELNEGLNYKPTSKYIKSGSLLIGGGVGYGMADRLKWINASSTTFDDAALVLGAMGSKTIGVGIIASAHSDTSGYVKFANGLLIQWGLLPAASSGKDSYVSFAIEYTNYPAIMVTTRGSSDSDYGRSNLGQVIGTKSGFKCDTNYGSTTKVRLYWLAIGY